jgi:hypothetical protein
MARAPGQKDSCIVVLIVGGLGLAGLIDLAVRLVGAVT